MDENEPDSILTEGFRISFHPAPPGIPYPLLSFSFLLSNGETKTLSVLGRNAPEAEMRKALQNLDAALAAVVAVQERS